MMRHGLRIFSPSFLKRVPRLAHPISDGQLRSRLDAILPDRVDTLFVHASLSSCGHFVDGPERVLDAIIERGANVGFPTHSYDYPLSNIEASPIFNRKTTRSQTGLLTELFRQRPSVVRSNHATHSLAFLGDRARDYCEGHDECDTPCGRGTPYSKLIANRAAVLLFGVTFHRYTLFHTAEDDAASEFAYEADHIDRLRVLDAEGREHCCRSLRQSRKPRRYEAIGDELFRLGLARRIMLESDYLTIVPDCSLVHDELVARISAEPEYTFTSHEPC